MSDHDRWTNGLAKQLTDLAKPENPNRAALAHLRRGLGDSPDYTLARVGWLFRSVPDDFDDKPLDNAILVAGLFAWVKGACKQTENVNFGRAFGTGLTEDDKKQREKRFVDLLDTDADDLPYKLRQAVTLIARDAIGLDWALLARHLMQWNNPDRWVQKEWARGFWSNPVAETETAELPVTTL